MFELYKLVSLMLESAFTSYFNKTVEIYQSEVVPEDANFPYVTFDIQGVSEEFDETTMSIVIDIYTKTENSRAEGIQIRDIIVRRFKEIKRISSGTSEVGFAYLSEGTFFTPPEEGVSSAIETETVGASIYYESDFPLFTNEKLVKRHQVVFGASVRICYASVSFKE